MLTITKGVRRILIYLNPSTNIATATASRVLAHIHFRQDCGYQVKPERGLDNTDGSQYDRAKAFGKSLREPHTVSVRAHSRTVNYQGKAFLRAALKEVAAEDSVEYRGLAAIDF